MAIVGPRLSVLPGLAMNVSSPAYPPAKNRLKIFLAGHHPGGVGSPKMMCQTLSEGYEFLRIFGIEILKKFPDGALTYRGGVPGPEEPVCGLWGSGPLCRGRAGGRRRGWAWAVTPVKGLGLASTTPQK